MRGVTRPSVFTIGLAVGLLGLFTFVIYPIAFILYGSFIDTPLPGRPGPFTGKNYVTAFTNIKTLNLLVNTLTYAFGSATFAVAIATTLAIVGVRTDAPLRGILAYVPFLPLVLPGMVDNLVWIYLASPRTGLINVALMDLFGLDFAPFNIYSMGGMIWTMGISMIPASFIITSSALRSMDPSLEDAARIAGSGVVQTLRRVTLPLNLPAIFSVWLLMFILAVESFETPAMIGTAAKIEVFMSSIYQSISWTVPPEYGVATARATIILFITMTLVYVYRRSTRRIEKYQVITGKAYQPRAISLGRWKYLGTGLILSYIIIHIGLLIATVTLLSFQPFWDPRDLVSRASLRNFETVLSHPRVTVGLVNSSISSAVAATLIAFVATTIAYIAHKTRIRGRGYLEAAGMLPIAVPGLVIGVGLLWTFLTLPIGIWGTLVVVIIAYVLRYLPFGIRTTAGSVIQIHGDLEEASKVTGASFARTLRSIIFPLLRPAMLSLWVYVFISSFKTLGEIILLTTPRNEVLATVLWDLWVNGNVPLLAAASVLLIILLWTFLIVVVVVFKVRIVRRGL